MPGRRRTEHHTDHKRLKKRPNRMERGRHRPPAPVGLVIADLHRLRLRRGRKRVPETTILKEDDKGKDKRPGSIMRGRRRAGRSSRRSIVGVRVIKERRRSKSLTKVHNPTKKVPHPTKGVVPHLIKVVVPHHPPPTQISPKTQILNRAQISI